MSVDTLARSVTKGGHPEGFEPKVFDLVVFLLTHRDRVVTKRELLDAIWGRQVVVTEGVVARIVMKARRLIAEDDSQVLIRTVHRVGYRFVAPPDFAVHELLLRERVAQPVNPAVRAPTRPKPHVAVLPFLDRTRGIEHSWVSLGLMSATIEGLRRIETLTVASAGEVLAVVGSDEPVSIENALGKVTRALGATDVVQALVEDHGSGIRLRYLGAGNCLRALSGDHSGVEPVELSARLVEAVAAIAGSPVGSPPRAETAAEDPFVTAARLRAAEAMGSERWEAAGKLLRVALDARPEDASLQMEYARCLVWLRDPRAAALLEAMQRSQEGGHDRQQQARVLQLMASHRQGRGQLAEAKDLFSQSLRVAEEVQDQGCELVALISLGSILLEEGTASVGNWMLDRALLLARSLGNQAVVARVYDIRGQLATLRGDTPAARRELESAVQTAEAFGLSASAAFSLCHLGQHRVGLGQMDDAMQAFGKAFHFALRSGHPVAIGMCGASSALCGGIWRGDERHASHTVERMRQHGGEQGTVIHSYADLLSAALAARAGDVESALDLVDRAVRGNARQGFQYFALRLRIRLLLCLGAFEEAGMMCDELRTRATGRMRHQVHLVTAHYRALIAHAQGDDATAMRLLWPLDGIVLPMFDQADALLDGAWLNLEAGEPERARHLLSKISSFMQEALRCGHGPALLVQARLMHETGCANDAVELQRRYCEMMTCPPESGTAKCLAVYEGALDTGLDSDRLPRIRVLPSLFDIAPGMLASRLPAAGPPGRVAPVHALRGVARDARRFHHMFVRRES